MENIKRVWEIWRRTYQNLSKCKKAGDVKESLQEHIIDFSIEFANDSGNVPAC